MLLQELQLKFDGPVMQAETLVEIKVVEVEFDVLAVSYFFRSGVDALAGHALVATAADDQYRAVYPPGAVDRVVLAHVHH